MMERGGHRDSVGEKRSARILVELWSSRSALMRIQQRKALASVDIQVQLSPAAVPGRCIPPPLPDRSV